MKNAEDGTTTDDLMIRLTHYAALDGAVRFAGTETAKVSGIWPLLRRVVLVKS